MLSMRWRLGLCMLQLHTFCFPFTSEHYTYFHSMFLTFFCCLVGCWFVVFVQLWICYIWICGKCNQGEAIQQSLLLGQNGKLSKSSHIASHVHLNCGNWKHERVMYCLLCRWTLEMLWGKATRVNEWMLEEIVATDRPITILITLNRIIINSNNSSINHVCITNAIAVCFESAEAASSIWWNPSNGWSL
jgi:hypothetical protein